MEYILVNDKSYEVKKLLGKGKGGYSYLAMDGEKQFVLKQIYSQFLGLLTIKNLYPKKKILK